jgi:rubrerythrin
MEAGMDRYPNKRIRFRRGGKFCRPPSLEDMGLPVAKGKMTCAGCGHTWRPVLTTGICPECGEAEKAKD